MLPSESLDNDKAPLAAGNKLDLALVTVWVVPEVVIPRRALRSAVS